MPQAQTINNLINEAARLVAAGLATQAEAEGILLGALNYLAPTDAESANERYMAQLPPDFKQQVDGFVKDLSQARKAHLDKARKALLAISDEEWSAAGGGE